MIAKVVNDICLKIPVQNGVDQAYYVLHPSSVRRDIDLAYAQPNDARIRKDRPWEGRDLRDE